MEADLEKLEANPGGVADMKRQPDAVFVVDLKKEQLAVRETHRLGVPIIGLVDTNADPDEANNVIPAMTTRLARVTSSPGSSPTESPPDARRSRLPSCRRRPSETAAAPESPRSRRGAGSRDEGELEPAVVAEGSESE